MIKIPILMTATVNPRGMKTARFFPEEREKMYVETIQYYIDLFSKFRGGTLVFVENSEWPKERIFSKLKTHTLVEIEYISLPSNLFDPSKDKSYNEMLLMDMATRQSNSIKNAGRFFKVTGRYPIANLDKLVREVERRGGIEMRFFADCKDHNVYEWLHMPINGHVGESRYWAMSLDFYDEYMRGKYVTMGPPSNKIVETHLLEIIRATKHLPGVTIRFRTQAHITGLSGHNLGKGFSFFYGTDNEGVALTIKRGLRQFLRWTMPWWWC